MATNESLRQLLRWRDPRVESPAEFVPIILRVRYDEPDEDGREGHTAIGYRVKNTFADNARCWSFDQCQWRPLGNDEADSVSRGEDAYQSTT